jgi:hypothetical protein
LKLPEDIPNARRTTGVNDTSGGGHQFKQYQSTRDIE